MCNLVVFPSFTRSNVGELLLLLLLLLSLLLLLLLYHYYIIILQGENKIVYSIEEKWSVRKVRNPAPNMIKSPMRE